MHARRARQPDLRLQQRCARESRGGRRRRRREPSTTSNTFRPIRSSIMAPDAKRSKLDLWGASVTLDWKLAAYTLRSISAWRTFDAFLSSRHGRLAVRNRGSRARRWTSASSRRRLQLLGATHDDRLNWITGLYYLDEEADDDSDFSAAAFDLQSGGRDIINRSVAIFGQATYRLSEAVALTAGRPLYGGGQVVHPDSVLHTQRDWRPSRGSRDRASRQERARLFEADLSGGAGDHARSRSVALRVVVHRLQERRFRAEKPGSAPAAADVRPGDRGSLRGRDQNHGAGWTVAAQRRGLHQLTIRTCTFASSKPTTFAPVTSNAGDARIRGVELEFEATPLTRLRIAGGVGYLHGRYTRIAPNVPDITLDSRLTDSPDWSGNLSAIGSLAESLSGRIDWSYRSAHFNDAENTPELRQEAFHVLNASATWRCASCRDRVWSATLGCTQSDG